jgi:hypothetical protein
MWPRQVENPILPELSVILENLVLFHHDSGLPWGRGGLLLHD